jgi:hypothetical protein
MKQNIACFLAVLLVMNACTPGSVPQPQPSPPIPANTHFYLSKIVTVTNYTSETLWGDANPRIPALRYLFPYSMSFDTVNMLLKDFIFVNPTGISRGQSFFYDNVSLLPVAGRKSSSYCSCGPSGNISSNSDSVLYTITNGKVTGIIVCNHRGFSVAPGGISFNPDTSRRITIAYTGNNPSTVTISNTDGSSVRMDFAFGTKKSPLFESKIKYVLNPDDEAFLSLTTHYADLFTDNEILTITRTTIPVTGATKVEKVTYTYVYNDLGYPVTAQGVYNTGETFTQTFVYE